ncbi:MAG: hypothetical protein ACLFN8_02630 [Candidatus Woesearchaeota archaeon]
MDILRKASILGNAGRFDSCGPSQCEVKVGSNLNGLYHAPSERKDCIIFKTLMSDKCSFDCAYCPNSSRSKQKSGVSFSSSELHRVFMNARKSLGVNGLFLSSGMFGNSDDVMSSMIDAANKIRQSFGGYIHLKIMPGASFDHVKEACRVANRVSLNIEAPSASALSKFSDLKDFKVDILRRQAWIKRLGSSQSTQMIVSESVNDFDVLKMSNWEYANLDLKRVYYSALRPVKGTPLENFKAESLFRQNNLYRADFLLREYGFKLGEIQGIMEDSMLPRVDPKVLLARTYFSGRLDVNEAEFDELIRVPGIGFKSCERILSARKTGSRISNFSDLRKFGANINFAAPFISIGGKVQSSLFDFS